MYILTLIYTVYSNKHPRHISTVELNYMWHSNILNNKEQIKYSNRYRHFILNLSHKEEKP
jgi:hypothetical protein